MAQREASRFPSPVFSAKSKTPQDAPVVLALGESNNKAIGNEAKSLACCLARPPQNPAGFSPHSLRPDATPDSVRTLEHGKVLVNPLALSYHEGAVAKTAFSCVMFK